jgi:hypothetical protein
MRYYLVQQEDHPENTWYYILDDSCLNVIKQIDMNCNEVTIGVPHFIVDTNPPLPPCAE